MKRYKSKLGRTINFIKNENKLKRSDYVKVIKNTSKYSVYDKYVGQKAIVTNIDYEKKNYIVGLKFLDGANVDFKMNEIEKLDDMQMYDGDYTKLIKSI